MREKIKILTKRNISLNGNCPKLLAASVGDMKGEIDLQWDPVARANLYIIQISIYSSNLNWSQFDIISKSSYTVSGLRSRKRYCFRVAAVNTCGKGPWSETISKVAP